MTAECVMRAKMLTVFLTSPVRRLLQSLGSSSGSLHVVARYSIHTDRFVVYAMLNTPAMKTWLANGAATQRNSETRELCSG